MIRVTLYSKEDCSLCDDVRAELEVLKPDYPHRLVDVEIDHEPTMMEKYGDAVPVVMAGPYTLKAPFSMTDLQVTIGAAIDGERSKKSPSERGQRWALRLNRGLRFFSVHWLAFFNFLVLLYVGLPFLAPTLMKIGATTPASWIYTLYSPLCHQLAFRSWFLFGPQVAYPRQLAGTGLVSYGEATGFGEDDLWTARNFVGNEQLGYKTAFCERDIAIYAAILLAGLIFALVKNRGVKPIPIWLWISIGVVPIALDGFSQLFSQLPIDLLGLGSRESTPLLRTVTGALFGFMSAWLAYPYFEQSMAEYRAVLNAKLGRVDAASSSPDG